jgi:transposase-like protein
MHKPHYSRTVQRVQMVSELIANAGQYGMVSSVSRRYGVSRESLYTWKEKGKDALRGAFTPKRELGEEELQVERAVLTLLTEGHASYRGIQACLENLLGIHVSIGKITSIVQEAGKRAQTWMEHQIPEGMRALAGDCQYGSKRGEAYLNIVDVHSGLVLASIPPVAVNGESWTLLFWQRPRTRIKMEDDRK